MNPIDLVRLQITLEYDLDDHGRLVPFPGSSEQIGKISPQSRRERR